MCKKDYTQAMNNYLREVSFRLVFYSLPQFKDKFIEEFVGLFPEGNKNYKEDVLMDVELQTVDVDAIAADLGYPIVDVARARTYVFDNVTIANQMATVYVNPYYVYVNVHMNEGEKSFSDDFINDLNKIFGCKALEKCAIKQFYCLTSHSCELEQVELNEVLDLKAFPQMDWERLGGAVYVDNYKNGDYSVDLKRIVGRMIENKVMVTIQTSTRIESGEEVYVDYKDMYDASLNEVARCFNDGKKI